VFFAADLSRADFASNISVGRFPGEVAALEEVELPSGPALRVELTGVVQTARAVSIDGVQRYVSDGGSTYVITISAGDVGPALVEAVGESFRGS